MAESKKTIQTQRERFPFQLWQKSQKKMPYRMTLIKVGPWSAHEKTRGSQCSRKRSWLLLWYFFCQITCVQLKSQCCHLAYSSKHTSDRDTLEVAVLETWGGFKHFPGPVLDHIAFLTVRVNSLCQFGWAMMTKYVVKNYFGLFL